MVLKTVVMDGKRNYYCHFSTETIRRWRDLPKTERAQRQHRTALQGKEWSCQSREMALFKAWLICVVGSWPLLTEGSCCAQKEFYCKASSMGGKRNQRTVLCRPPMPLVPSWARRSPNTNLLPFTGDSHAPVKHGGSGGNYWSFW